MVREFLCYEIGDAKNIFLWQNRCIQKGTWSKFMRVECQFDLHLFKEKKEEVENLKDDETLSTVLSKSCTKILGASKQKGKEKEKLLSELSQQ